MTSLRRTDRAAFVELATCVTATRRVLTWRVGSSSKLRAESAPPPTREWREGVPDRLEPREAHDVAVTKR